MLNIQVHDNDAEALIRALESVHTLSEIDLRDDPGLRYALANIVGLLRTQAAIETFIPFQGIHKRVVLKQLMVDKHKQWEAERVQDGCGKSAGAVLEYYLDIAGLLSHCFVTGNDAASTIASFLATFEGGVVATYELQLCTYTDEELEALSLEDMAHALILE